ncbi:undecaprenyldiphospho-muramoylpentapeptide beta-N-acetylglucosaminyltransferase [Sulfurospirillum cavolei]|uniref:undecaprenyldiphospho-muramoylpentapeptide beta-N-acetylglucosaminyltransferase n=1 Tax=Sulfurospirillum cavolei TaxID=366522 RepID=UPI0005A63D93|nr:undecaprenyldiphospho-muramoylpentapeptide beta-N-acetylglucosaminyltransferase [Sulfurospirillum cavolei]
MIAITGGGTGGHLVIARAIKEELLKRGHKPLYIGSTAGQDRAWFEGDEAFERTYFLESSGVVNKKGIHKLRSLFTTVRLAFTCRRLFKQHGVSAVFSVGGYSAAPASFGALIARLPLYIHEQNAVEGKLNRLLKPFAKAFFNSYRHDAIMTDYPVSDAFFAIRKQRQTLKTVIFLGGSQGATFINELACTLAPFFHERGIAIIHQTGAKEFERIRRFYEKTAIPADVFDFSKEIAQKLSRADFAISRSGASTLWELCAASLPACFIPYPHAAANHQYYNAKTLVDQGAALMMEQANVDSHKLFEMILACDLASLSQKLTALIHEGGAKAIVDTILQNQPKESTC